MATRLVLFPIFSLRTGMGAYRAFIPRAQVGVGGRTLSRRGMSETTENRSGFVPRYQVKPLDRFLLIITRTMKPGEIPSEISYDLLEKAQSRRRIMVNLSLMIFTAFGSAYAIYRGRKARDSGEDTVLETNLKKYEQYEGMVSKKSHSKD